MLYTVHRIAPGFMDVNFPAAPCCANGHPSLRRPPCDRSLVQPVRAQGLRSSSTLEQTQAAALPVVRKPRLCVPEHLDWGTEAG